MERFAELFDRLATTTQRSGKIRLLARYFHSAPDPDRGWALAALTGALPFSFPLRRILAQIITPHVDSELYRLSRDYVGDTAETVALLWPEGDACHRPPPRLAEIIGQIQRTSNRERARTLAGLLDRLDATGRWALLRFLSGALKVGVSARLARIGLAEGLGAHVDDIEEVWHAQKPPFGAMFDWLEGRAPRPGQAHSPVFRPLMLSQDIAEQDIASLAPCEVIAEWKWDGVRVQIASLAEEVRVFSRAGDDITGAFPDVAEAFRGWPAVLDGELLVIRGGEVRPFADVQQRLNRKTVTERLLESFPAHVRLYDLLFDGAEDIRSLSLIERRARLDSWFARQRPAAASLSEILAFESFAALKILWANSRRAGIEGLMLKRRSSPYLAGRPKGHWFKWKRPPLTADCVLLYAARGSGSRSSYYCDYTFGAWRTADAGNDELVPVGKAYSGFTDQELLRLDRWVRQNTVERFGPVRQVRPALVLEIAFDAIQPSARHKSGLALRFPRVHRIRWDKPVAEADRLETLMALNADSPVA